MHSATVIPRMPASLALRRAAAFLALAAVACLVLAACSPGADYPSLFPSVHDIPPPHTDTPLDSNQVQQATEDLISARDRLSAEAQDAHGKNSTSSAVKPVAKSPTKSPANSPANSADKSSAKAAAGPAAASKQPSTPVSARQTLGTDAEQTAGTETK
ncbi:MAG: hypothetical protein ACLQF4_08015 [Xanthobacteraceae bacterium]